MTRTSLGIVLVGALAGCSQQAGAPPPSPSESPAPPPSPSLNGTILVAIGGHDLPSRIVAIDPTAPPSAAPREVTPAGTDSYFPAATAVPMAIRTSDRDGEHLEQLVLLGATAADTRAVGPISPWVRSPVASRDGGAVVVEIAQAAVRNLHRLDVATGALVQLTDDPEGNFEPTLSPDGARVAFTSSRDGDNELYVMDLPPAGGAPGPATRLTAFHRDDWSPRWSPAGDAIAFLSDREGTPRLFVIAPDGTGVRPAHTGELAGEEQTPVWSPDGTQLAYAVVHGTTSELWVADLATGKATRISAAGARDEVPAWSPDGKHLVHVSTRAGRVDLWIAAADGSGERRLTDTAEEEWIPRWHGANGPPGSAP